MKNLADDLMDIIEGVAGRIDGSVFNSFGVFEQIVEQLMEQYGGNRWVEAKEQSNDLPGGYVAFRSSVCNKLREKSKINFESK